MTDFKINFFHEWFYTIPPSKYKKSNEWVSEGEERITVLYESDININN